VSYISPESVSLLEEFHTWKLFGCPNIYELPARAAEAFYVLETELRSEYRRAQQ
jgi:hypothetical protein